ncbi:hypothetical protein E2C01_034126 [Portunus trituberculatus]|uniref:Uncharacterized protein n=1 Tax=Portunus trituberculatus TaxID=210409 RepID=A0A5B7F4M9_PORTR|nr:hypothetical protein [Portunus trituberculatus]
MENSRVTLFSKLKGKEEEQEHHAASSEFQETDREVGEARVHLLFSSSLMRDFLHNERQRAEV